MPQGKKTPTSDQSRTELAVVLASDVFRRAPALSGFLSFICEETLQDRSDRLKEYTIAVEALGRPNDFHPSENPIVRVQAARLRQCLKEYYRGEGKLHPVHILLPKGQYVPEFRLNPSQGEATCVPDEASSVPPASQPVEVEPPQAPPPAARRRWILMIAACSVLAIAAAAVVWNIFAPRESAHPPGSAPGGDFSSTSSDGDTIRILAGYPNPQYIDQLGRTWMGDRYYRGGRAEQTVNQPLVRAEDRNLWLHARGGEDFSYDIPLKPGPHELHLHFAEPVFGADPLTGGGETARLFEVSANGHKLLESFDILGDAGDPKVAVEKVFTDITPGPDGLLHLQFAARSSEAIVNGIEILPSDPHRMRPIRVVTRNMPYASPNGVIWGPDRYSSGGRTHLLTQSVAGTEDPGLYASERFGNFSYTFPVAPGIYTAVLHFSEVYHGPSNPGGGGSVSRLFDVYFNGIALLKEFDIFKEAGSNRALRREFHGLKPNGLGKLVFTFQPIKNYPCVDAIEIIPE